MPKAKPLLCEASQIFQISEALSLLPTEIKSLADRCFEALRENSRHPSLHFKRIGKCWSARIGLNYRALGIPEEYGVLWFWIGPHSDYTQLLRRLRDRKIE